MRRLVLTLMLSAAPAAALPDTILIGGIIFDGSGTEAFPGGVAITGDRISGLGAMLEEKEIASDVASFVGATTVRVNELGEQDIDPTPEQLDRMRGLVRAAMNEGAPGVGSLPIYAPAACAETPELIALATRSAKCGGMYISHLRSKRARIEKAVDELIEIARKSGGPAEIHHMKMSGKKNRDKMDSIVGKVEPRRASGTPITADRYNYTAGTTGFDAAMPLWVQDGGLEAWSERLRNPVIRARVKVETLGEVARTRVTRPEDTAIDLVIEDSSRVGTAFVMMDEANRKRRIGPPWMSFGCDAGAPSAKGVFRLSNSHPSAHGNAARLLGKYVRGEKAATLPDAIRRLTLLPVSNPGIKECGLLRPGYFADVAVCDSATIANQATCSRPAQYACGV